jgi:hypothetical protein
MGHGGSWRPTHFIKSVKYGRSGAEYADGINYDVLYEQVTVVNVFPYQGLCFCCCRCVCWCSPPGLYSHSDESHESGLGAGWGSRGESMLQAAAEGVDGFDISFCSSSVRPRKQSSKQ